MKLLGLTPWRVFLIFWAAFCVTVASAVFGYDWAVIACHYMDYVATGVGALAFVVVCVLLVWEKVGELRRGNPLTEAHVGITTAAAALVAVVACSWLGYGWAQTTTHVIGWVLLATFIVLMVTGVIVSKIGERRIRKGGNSR